MLRITLEKLVVMLEQTTGASVTIGQLAERTGIHRNIISRLLNNPESSASTAHLDKIIEYFYWEMQKTSKMENCELVSSIMTNLFEFFPEGGSHKGFLDSLAKIGGWSNIPAGVLWEFYRLYQGTGEELQGQLPEEWEARERTKQTLLGGSQSKKLRP